jgi:hypothetical protein
MTASGASRFESEALLCLCQCANSLQHQASGLDGAALRIERRKTARDFVGVNELDES